MDWNASAEYCEQREMQMATLKTSNELLQVAEQLYHRVGCKMKTEDFQLFSTFRFVADPALWLSASDIGQEHGQFHWSDGSPVDKSTWRMGQPDSALEGQETCVFFGTFYVKLYDESCSGTNTILCEVPAARSDCL
jgi:Lectin C-type domain